MSSSSNSQDSLPFNFDAWCKVDANVVESVPIQSKPSFTFVMTINKFSSRPEKPGESIKSEEFFIKGPDNKVSKWHVEVFPRGFILRSTNVWVYLCTTSAEDVNAKVVVSRLDANMTKQKLQESQVRKFRSFEVNYTCFPRCNIANYAPSDTLTLVLDIIVIADSKESIDLKENENNLAQFKNSSYQKLIQDLDSLFTSQEHSDVKVKCGEKEFNCHKIILSSRSPVFKAMLELNMKENQTGRIEIKDMNLDVFEDMLKYIYTCEAPNIDDHALELFSAADLYQLEDLKKLCELKLCSGIDVGNCINLLIFGDLHQALTLKKAVLDFVSKNMNMKKISEWKQSLIANPNLMFEVMEIISK